MKKNHSARFQAYYDFRRWSSDQRRQERAKKEAAAKLFLTTGQRNNLTDRVYEFMRCWRSSRFEFEGSARHGLRSAFCLQGHSWRAADAEAKVIVERALHRLGAERPSWDQGQPEYAIPRENCAWCYSPVSPELLVGEHHKSYCSSMCARSALQWRSYQTRTSQDFAYRAVRAFIERTSHPVRNCDHCGQAFHPINPHGRYCTRVCSQKASAKKLRVLPDYSCAKCGKLFRPAYRSQKYCSEACKYGAVSDFTARFSCDYCGNKFTARGRKALYCCSTCAQMASRIRSGSPLGPKRITPLVFDYVFREAA